MSKSFNTNGEHGDPFVVGARLQLGEKPEQITEGRGVEKGAGEADPHAAGPYYPLPQQNPEQRQAA